MRSLIPSVKSKRKMEVKKLEKREINAEDKKLKENSKFKDYNRLQINDKVHLHDGNAWNIKGIIINTSQHPRSYIIKTDKGTVVRHNRKHIQFNVRENKSDDSQPFNSDDDDSYSLIQLDEETVIPLNQVPNIEDVDLLMNNLSNLSIAGDSNISEPEILIPEPVTTRYGRRIQTPQHQNEYELES